jgi:hypothetical protein
MILHCLVELCGQGLEFIILTFIKHLRNCVKLLCWLFHATSRHYPNGIVLINKYFRHTHDYSIQSKLSIYLFKAHQQSKQTIFQQKI